ncbi:MULTISPECIES: hypothetical protein [unclassified Spirillospora]|uniref:hypothetical protein n=1 Tax=unclassified Spirillospora TaxID=2642701 RepID=UPI003718B8FB
MHVEFTITRSDLRRFLVLLAMAGVALITLAGCTEDAGDEEQDRTLGGYTRLVAQQPSKTMNYSPTRNTANFWIETWNKPGKLSYVYLQNGDGDLLGYYVFKGLPVPYCVSLTPPEQVSGTSDAGVVRKAPAVDGVYYGQGDCDRYFGIDATTNSYVEYTAGLGINVLLYDQPLTNRPNVEPLGHTRIDKDGKPVGN